MRTFDPVEHHEVLLVILMLMTYPYHS